ncbi:MAG TPA: hypothetical protein VMW29_03815 [Candidatus Bathyarchaeia archaeon]|nr:hypothetical protein [Candidatus Bathyarchaeia archaeon]
MSRKPHFGVRVVGSLIKGALRGGGVDGHEPWGFTPEELTAIGPDGNPTIQRDEFHRPIITREIEVPSTSTSDENQLQVAEVL